MTDLERQILQWFADAWLGPAIMRVPWLFPTLESLHFIGVCFLFGSLLLVDLRLLGFLRGGSAGLAFAYLWITVGAFALLLATGLCFFFTNPFNYWRSEEHTSELQSLMRISYAVFCLKKKNTNTT